mmetsp:Transcript_16472/g.40234  ORF Transcript_16472/g.40234 Transcript_16472/m.40234 type:complete len:118 (+) Transcript_16472:337-690(+)
MLLRLLKLYHGDPKDDHNNNATSRLVNLGAGVRDDDPTFPLLDDSNARWEALLVDGDPKQETAMAERFPNSERIRTLLAYITADSIPGLLSTHGFDQNVDLLKIDIDSFDCLLWIVS